MSQSSPRPRPAGSIPKVVLLCCPGLYQRHLARRLAATFRLDAIVVRDAPRPKGGLGRRIARIARPLDLARHLRGRAVIAREERRTYALKEELFAPALASDGFPAGVPLVTVADVNAPETVDAIRGSAPDVVCVNGTNLLRDPVLALAPTIPLGIVNLHTGLSPYARGGNCNLYELIEGRPEHVGLTVHHIDPGIDSGDLIITAQTPMAPDDCYEMIDARTFHTGIELMLVAVRQLAEGRAERVRQWEAGKEYLRRTGYVYRPWDRVRVARVIERGLVRDYLAAREARDRDVRLVGHRT